MQLFAYRMTDGGHFLICWKCSRQIPAERKTCGYCIRVEQNCSMPTETLSPSTFRVLIYLGVIGFIAFGLFLAARFGGTG